MIFNVNMQDIVNTAILMKPLKQNLDNKMAKLVGNIVYKTNDNRITLFLNPNKDSKTSQVLLNKMPFVILAYEFSTRTNDFLETTIDFWLQIIVPSSETIGWLHINEQRIPCDPEKIIKFFTHCEKYIDIRLKIAT
jgi:hypothetical protein